MEKLKIKVILGSIRERRFGEHPAKWIFELAKQNPEIDAELLDLRDYELPIFREAATPSSVKGEYRTPEINRWAEKIKEADGFIVVTPEYNHGYPASLKNNIDYLDKEWHKKAIGFVSYGTVGGARAVEQLRQVAIELHMAPIRNAVHISAPWGMLAEDGGLRPGALDSFEKGATRMMEELIWWTRALKEARKK